MKAPVTLPKRLLAAVICLCCSLSLFACAPSAAPESESQRDFTQSWPLSTAAHTLVVALDGDAPFLASLTDENGRNFLSADSPMFLPKVFSGELSGEFEWRFDKADQKDGSLVLSFLDERGFAYDLRVAAQPEYAGPFQISGEFYNNTDVAITYNNTVMFTASLDFDNQPTVMSVKKESGIAEGVTIYSGQKFEGSGIYKEELAPDSEQSISCSTANDWNNNGYIPIMYFDDGGAQGAYLAVEWPDCKITAVGRENGRADVSANMSEHFVFSTAVPAKGSLYIPEVYLGAYTGDIETGSNLFKRWFFGVKSPECLRDNPLEPYTQMDMQNGLDIDGWGIQSIKWDYGWWSNELANPASGAQWRTLEGSWQLRNSAYINVLRSYGCTTIREFTDLAHNRGLTMTIYLLLHDAIADVENGLTSVGENGHNEWFSNRTITVGRSADLGNEECVEYLKGALADFFTSTGVDTWRSDFEPIAFSSDRINRHGNSTSDVSYWCADGFYEIVDYLIETVDGFRYESCGSGGSMKDYATLHRAVIINNDDSADYNSLRTSFYDSSYCLPPAQLQLPCNIDTFRAGSAQYMGPADVDFGIRSVLMGAVMLSSWSSKTDAQLYTLYCNMYNENIKPLVRDGDLYHVLPRPDGINWDGVQYADADAPGEIKGCLFVFKPTDTEGPRKTVVLRGLDPDATYSIEFLERFEQNCTATGAELMDEGLDITIAGEMGSDIVWIKG